MAIELQPRPVAGVIPGRLSPYACAACLTLLIGGPWLLPGYIFGTDWPGPRHFLFPDQIWSGALFQLARAAASAIVGAELVTKLVILSSLFIAALTAYKALPVGGLVARAAAATIYTVNPFVFGRIHYGQLALIAGYSLLPWLAIGIRRLVLKPGLRPLLSTVLSLTLIGTLDLHVLLPAGLFAVAVVGLFAITRIGDLGYLVRLAAWGMGAAGLTVLASIYWLIPLLAGTNPQGQVVADLRPYELAIFRTVPDPTLGLLPNVLGLYGFWAENVSRFPSMKGFVPLWPVVLAGLVALAGVGAAANLWRPEIEFVRARPWILALLATGSLAVVLDMGFADPHVQPFIRWLDAAFPAYRGMRDAGKWAALIALVYAQLVPLGIHTVLTWIHSQPWAVRRAVLPALAAGLLLALPLYYGNGMLFGMHGEVQPSAYPAGWYEVDRILARDVHPGNAVFLPWHLYLRFGFIRNTNAVVATPAPAFFSVPVVVSADPEVPGLNPTNTPEQAAVEALISEKGSGTWSRSLAALNIEYVLLAREVDWKGYDYLGHQNGLVKVADFGSIILYRNVQWHPR